MKVVTVYMEMLLIWNRSKLMLELSIRDRKDTWMYTARAMTARASAAVLMFLAAGLEFQMSLMIFFLEM